MNNSQLSAAIKHLAALTRASGGSIDKAKRYERLAYTISRLPQPIKVMAETARLMEIPGVGPTTVALLVEYLNEGDSRERRRLTRILPETVQQLLSVPGIGPSTARTIYEKTHIERMEEFREALRNDRLEGVGPATRTRLKRHFDAETALSPQTALPI